MELVVAARKEDRKRVSNSTAGHCVRFDLAKTDPWFRCCMLGGSFSHELVTRVNSWVSHELNLSE